MIAVVSGATGLTGSLLLKLLLADARFDGVVSLVRRPSGAMSPKLREVLVRDLGEIPARASELHGDVYFCCLGTTIKAAGTQEAFRKVDQEAVLEFAAVAKAARAKAFVVITAFGADPKSSFFYNRVKGETEAALRALNLPKLVVFHPALIMGERAERRGAEKIFRVLMGAAAPLMPWPLRSRLMTPADRMAARMIEVALDGSVSRVVEPRDI